jgi:C4-type Zn-finger protein
MLEDGCSSAGCDCNATSLYTDRECPACGRRLRITGNLQRIKLRLTCQDCGYQSHELSMEEVREFID